MKKYLASLAIAVVVTPSFASETDGEVLYQQLCSACHVAAPPATVAPPVFAMVDHVKKEFPDQDGFVNRVVSWVDNPQADQALMAGAVDKFGLMPKLGYSSDQVKIIAEYLYEGEFTKPSGHGSGEQGNH